MKSTLRKKLLKFILPITMIPFSLVMIFYYLYLHKVLEDDVIDLQKSVLIYMVKDIQPLLSDRLKLEQYIMESAITLPEIVVFDKEMNLLATSFPHHMLYDIQEEYRQKSLSEHFKSPSKYGKDKVVNDKKHSVLIKPIIVKNEIIAYVISGYQNSVNAKMITNNQTFLYLLFVIIFTVFIISIFIIIFSLQLLHPLELLIDGIKKISHGNLSFSIKNVSNDEIGVVVDAFNDMTQKRKKVEEELEEMAIRDGLTGLYNHRHFYTLLENEIAREDRYHNSIALLLIDIDHFKHVNDTYGHRAGDMILKSLSERLKRRSRATDHVCRYGGEEIAIILLETGIREARSIAEEFRQIIEDTPFIIDDVYTIPITVSIGVSTYSEDAKDSATMVSNADEALYKAKNEGRNRVRVFGE